MANARTRFDTIASYLVRAHEARTSLLYGRPCLEFEGVAFAAFVRDALALRLHGRALAQALTLPGARPWHPRSIEEAAPGWVLLPVGLMLRWDRLALDALRWARERAAGSAPLRLPEAQPQADIAPRSTPESLAERFAAAVSRRFGGMRVARG
jgi:hypothetical protein